MEQLIWSPSEERIERANLVRFMRFARDELGDYSDVSRHAALYNFSIKQPERFWTLVWDFCGIKASGERNPVLVDADRMPGARWFPNVRLPFAQTLLRFDAERVALRSEEHKSELQSLMRISYAVFSLKKI